MERDRQRGVKQPLPAPLHLVAQAGDVLQGDLRLGGHGASALEGEALGRLEADLLPLQRPGGLLRRYRADVDGQVHRRARRHQPLEEAWGQRAGPAAQVQGANQAVSDAHLAASYLHLNGLVPVELGGGAAESGRREEHPKLAASQVVDGQPRPCQQPAQVVDAPEFAHGVEAPVEDAVAGLKVGEQAAERLAGGLRLRGKVVGLGLLQLLSHPCQTWRVLSDEQLRREVQGVERPGEGPQLRLVDLQAHHLADAELHPVQAHRAVVVQVRQHEEQGQVRRRLGGRGLRRCAGFRLSGESVLRYCRRSDGPVRGAPRSQPRDSFNQLLQFACFLCSMGLGRGRGRSSAAPPRPWPKAPGPGRPPP